jgi:hypothetical protein
VAREFNAVAQRAATRAGHHAPGIDTALYEVVDQRSFFGDGEGIRLAVGAEDRKANSLRKEPAALPDEQRRIRIQVFIERRDYRR